MKKVAIIGSGPSGLFCADRLVGKAEVTIYETGPSIEKRACPGSTCNKCPVCYVLEGEGGAGGLSDGKNTYSLSRGTQMEDVFASINAPWLKYIDEQMVMFAGKGVWYDPLPEPPEEFRGSPLEFGSYPLRHVGSDGIRQFVRGFTDDLRSRGVKILLNRTAIPTWTMKSGKADVSGVLSAKTTCSYDRVVIAAGLQGIPWIEYLMEKMGSPLGSGPAGFGIRLETDADTLAPLFRRFYDFKVVMQQSEDLTIRSFCCNQNGYVLNERHTDLEIVNVNGHSYLDPTRRTRSSNMAIIAKISGVDSPQEFVKSLGRRICDRTGGSAYQPIKEFMGAQGNFDRSYMTNPHAKHTNIHGLMPESLREAFRRFIKELDAIAPVISDKSIIYAPEIKYYGRRVNITEGWRCKDVRNMYVIGSGSGYLDSFVAAALSGIVAADDIQKGGPEW